jgi:asparagine synthase (glutamine-hydrolysing)
MQRYWDFETSNEIYSMKNDSEYARHFLDLFTDSVKIRLRSDVPIGSCLSGGLDSSSVVVAANNLLFPHEKVSASERQKTFSACFEDKRFDEREYIEEVINITGAERNYVFPTAQGFVSTLDNLLWHQEEPFAGSSIYAQWEVIRRASGKGVKVILDGQGGDEQLAGYRKFYLFYFMELLKQKRLLRLPSEVISFFFSPGILATLNLKSGLRYFTAGNRLLKVDDLLQRSFRDEFGEREPGIGYQGNLGLRMKEDLTRYSLPVLLRYEDRNSMAHAVETRLPLLDYRLVEMLATFPLDQKMRYGWTKYVLRNAMKGSLPENIRLRKSKLGFSPPEETWFKDTISRLITHAFDNPVFIPKYTDTKKLMDCFTKYTSGNPVYSSSVFFRFYILELWGRKFIGGENKIANSS